MKIYQTYENAVFYGLVIPYSEMTDDIFIYISGLSEKDFYNLFTDYEEELDTDGYLNLYDFYCENFLNKEIGLVWLDEDSTNIGIGIKKDLTKIVFKQQLIGNNTIKKVDNYLEKFKEKFLNLKNYETRGAFLVRNNEKC